MFLKFPFMLKGCQAKLDGVVMSCPKIGLHQKQEKTWQKTRILQNGIVIASSCK